MRWLCQNQILKERMSGEGSLFDRVGMQPADISRHILTMYNTHNALTMSIDAHCEDYLRKHADELADDQLVQFLHTCVYGLKRYRKMIEVFLSSFYYNYSGSVLRTDRDLYRLWLYLAVHQLENLGWADFKAFLLAEPAIKSRDFVTFLFNAKKLRKWVRHEWIALYDEHHIDDVVIAGLLSHQNQADTLLAYIKERVEGDELKMKQETYETVTKRDKAKGKKKKATVAKPFKLTEPKFTLVPEPEAIAIETKANPIPETTYVANDATIRAVEQAKRDNHRRVALKYSKEDEFDLSTHKRPSNMEKLEEEATQRLEAELDFDGPKATPMPDFDGQEEKVEIKMTTAAILREDALFRKKQLEEAQAIENYEAGLRDASEYFEWQQRMRAMDDEEREREIEARKQEMARAAEEAAKARERKLEENKQVAEEVRKQKEEIKREKKALNAKVEAHNRKIVEEVQDQMRGKVRAAKKEILESKKAQVADLIAQRKRLEEQKRIREEFEQKQREERIRQIRAIERVPKQRVVIVDPTETPGTGLMAEMSTIEVRERLAMQQRQEEFLREEKRKEILAEKHEKEERIKRKLVDIARRRQAAHKESKERRIQKVQKKRAAERVVREASEERALVLHDKLEEKRKKKREEERRLAQERKAIQIKNQFLRADKETVEEQKFAELEAAEERMTYVRQLERLRELQQKKLTAKNEEKAKKRHRIIQKRQHEAVEEDFARRMAEADAHALLNASG